MVDSKKFIIIFVISLFIIAMFVFGFVKYKDSQLNAINSSISNFKNEGISLEQGYDYCDKKVNIPTMRFEDYCYYQLATEFKSDEPCYKISKLGRKDICFGFVGSIVHDYNICNKAESEGVRNPCILQNDIYMLGTALTELKKGNREKGLELCDKIITNNAPCYLAYVGLAKNYDWPLDSSYCDKMFLKEDFKVTIEGEERTFDNEKAKSMLQSAKDQCYNLVRS